MRPPMTTGCVPPELAPGNPNAHLNFRCGRSSAVIPAASPGSKREFVTVTPQPFQAGPPKELRNVRIELPQNADLGMGFGSSLPNDLPERYSERAWRCARLRSAA